MGQTAFGLVICNSSLHIIAVSYAPIQGTLLLTLHLLRFVRAKLNVYYILIGHLYCLVGTLLSDFPQESCVFPCVMVLDFWLFLFILGLLEQAHCLFDDSFSSAKFLVPYVAHCLFDNSFGSVHFLVPCPHFHCL
jgi:hypothetical protein